MKGAQSVNLSEDKSRGVFPQPGNCNDMLNKRFKCHYVRLVSLVTELHIDNLVKAAFMLYYGCC